MAFQRIKYMSFLAASLVLGCLPAIDVNAQEETASQARPTSAPQQIVMSKNEFGIELYKRAVASDSASNVVFSPLSVTSAMMPLLLGSSGETQVQLLKAMQIEAGELSQALQQHTSILKTLSPSDAGEISSSDNEHLGVTLRDVEKGEQIVNLKPGSLAEKLGLHPGDILLNLQEFVAGEASLGILRGRVSSEGRAEAGALSMGTAIWTDPSITLKPDFARQIESSLQTTSHQVDFKDGKGAAGKINKWVADLTKQQIQRIVGDGDVQDAGFVVTNAVYFQGAWKHPFNVEETDDKGEFRLVGGETVTVPMMKATLTTRFVEAADVKHVLLNYADGHTAMLLSVPNEAEGLSQLESSLTADSLAKTMQELRQADESPVRVLLPRTSLQWQADFRGLLGDLGVKALFGSDANLSTMTSVPCSVGQVLHQAKLEVNEKGTTASAATGAVGPRFSNVPIIRADHPFLLTIMDTRTMSILFMAHVAAPQP